jgi:hypothetical protein
LLRRGIRILSVCENRKLVLKTNTNIKHLENKPIQILKGRMPPELLFENRPQDTFTELYYPMMPVKTSKTYLPPGGQ